MFLFCALHLNKIKAMAEKQMTPREHIGHLKILREVITANICSMKVIEYFYMGGLFVFQIPDFCFLCLAVVLMSKSSLLWICIVIHLADPKPNEVKRAMYFH